MPDTPENGGISLYWLTISIYATFHVSSSYYLIISMSGGWGTVSPQGV
jgi:hypothetical protein